ncbi:MAG: hypothetical protein Q9210_005859, partial [Variospora velana]
MLFSTALFSTVALSLFPATTLADFYVLSKEIGDVSSAGIVPLSDAGCGKLDANCDQLISFLDSNAFDEKAETNTIEDTICDAGGLTFTTMGEGYWR